MMVGGSDTQRHSEPQPRAGRFIDHLARRSLLALMLALTLAAGAVAAAAETEAAPGAPGANRPADSAASAALQRLEELAALAPARQIGQPGNDAIDALVQKRFEEAVARHTTAADRESVEPLLAAARQADDTLIEVRSGRGATADAVKSISSSWLVRVTLEEPGSLAALLFLMGAATFFAAWIQKRKSAWIVGGVFIACMPVLLIVAAKIETPSEAYALKMKAASASAVIDKELLEASLNAFAADKKLAAALAGRWQSGRVWHHTAAYVPGDGLLSLVKPGGEKSSAADAKPVRIWQMSPNLVEPANLPQAGLEGPLVYAGAAMPAELAGRSFDNAIVLVEFASSTRWIEAVQLGARAVLVLDPPEGVTATFTEAAQKTVNAPLSVPRFYVRRAELQAALGDDWRATLLSTPRIRIEQTRTGRWERRHVASDWIFIPGSVAPAKDKTEFDADLGRQLMVVMAPKDTISIVPELSPGATGVANLAMLLTLLERFEQQPPRRPVLLAAVNDHSNGLMGEHELGWSFFSAPEAAIKELAEIENELAEQRFLVETYGNEPTVESIETMRSAEGIVGGKLLRQKEMAVDRLTQGRNLMRDERNRLQFRIEEDDRRVRKGQPARLDPAARAQIEEEIKKLVFEADERTKLLRLFNRFGESTRLDQLPPEGIERTKKLFAEIAETARIAAEGLEASRREMLDNLAVRRRLAALASPAAKAPATSAEAFAQRYPRLPAALGLALDLSFDVDRLGLFHLDHTRAETNDLEFLPTTNNRFNTIANYLAGEAASYSQKSGATNRMVPTISGTGGVPWAAFLGGRFAFAGRTLLQFSIPQFTLASINDSRPRDFTPDDQLERLDRRNFTALASFVLGYVPHLADAPDIGASGTAINTHQPFTAQVNVRQLDQFSIGVPRTLRPDALIVALPAATGSKLPNNADLFGAVRPMPIFMADHRGFARIRGGQWRDASLQIFGYDKAFRRIEAVSDLTAGEKRFNTRLAAPITSPFVTKILSVAAFDKIDLIGLTEPLTLQPVSTLGVIDAQQDSLPRYYSLIGVNPSVTVKPVPSARIGVASVFVEPGRGFKLRPGSGLVINATPDRPQGEGFESDVGMIRNAVLTSADDLWSLTETRLSLLQSKGVRNETASQYQALARTKIDEAHAAGKAGQNDRLMVDAERGRGLAYQSYVRGLSTINDLIKAVVIFLALVIPFCFFITKLLSPFDDINRQLAMFGVVFVAMAVTLRLVHPAFEVARTPEVVILAFIIMGLAAFVATILVGRFNSSMTQAIEESQLAESVEAPQGRLAGVAFLVGVNNMKRRRIRTSLTCATVVLVTFTMLSVISVGQDVEPAVVRASGEAPYSGFLFTQPGLGEIDAVRLQRLRAHFQGEGMQNVARVWAQRLGTYKEYLSYDITPVEPIAGAQIPSLSAKVLLGLEKAEHGFLGPMPLSPGGEWFSSNDAAEIALSVKAAALLGITPQNMAGQVLKVAGRSLKLVALLDDEALEARRDMADAPFLPLLIQASLSAESSTSGAAQNPSASLSDLPGVEVARPIDIAFVPLGMARSLGDADYRTLSVKFTDESPAEASRRAWEEANELIQFQTARVGVGLTDKVVRDDGQRSIEPGQYQMTSSSSTEVGGVLKIAIPIILAATIILNTMLGSVMERRREVAIYNAIGLNPGHVMTFFLAESLVFGMVGSVAGYLIGQILSLAVTRFNLPLNLNYSSLSVMVVIFLTIATVLLSTVYPAMMAARAAVPSGQRRWSLPSPKGDQIFVQFPFSYDATRVLGICAYLRDYMKQNSEASTGKFLARLGPVGHVPALMSAPPAESDTAPGAGAPAAAASAGKTGSDAPRAYAMVFDIAPAPFDLGVNQKMEIYAYYDPAVKAHMLAVHLTRTSGEVGNWVTVNQPFLEALRKRLLGWRSQKPTTHEAFFHEGEKLFADALNLPVVAPSPERA